jgi:hypothetical protein
VNWSYTVWDYYREEYAQCNQHDHMIVLATGVKITTQEVEYFACFRDQMSRWLMHPTGKCWQIEGVMLCSHIKRPQVFIVGD